MLHFSGRRTPTSVFVHGYLTVNGEKMSKSRGTGLDPMKYRELGMDPEWLRYYFAAKLSSRSEDVDFHAGDFQNRVNSDLIGKYVNIASRTAGFIVKRFDGRLGALDQEGAALLAALRGRSDVIQASYAARETGRAMREIILSADLVNEYIDRNKPWELVRADGQDVRLQQVCTTCIEAFRLLTIYLKPVLPALAACVETFLRCEPLNFAAVEQELGAQHRVNAFRHLMQRVDPERLDELFLVAAERVQ